MLETSFGPVDAGVSALGHVCKFRNGNGSFWRGPVELSCHHVCCLVGHGERGSWEGAGQPDTMCACMKVSVLAEATRGSSPESPSLALQFRSADGD